MGARSAAGAVDVGLGGARQLEVHHVVDRGEVEAARGDVGGEQGALGLRDETIDRLEAGQGWDGVRVRGGVRVRDRVRVGVRADPKPTRTLTLEVERLEACTLLHVALQRDDIDLQPGEQRAQPAGGGGRWREG